MNRRKEFPVDELEWESQERGMRAARDRVPEAMDPAADSYRRVARALASARHCEPPADFAATVVSQVAIRGAWVERALLRGLVLVLAVASVIVTALYLAPWWRAVQGALTGGALQWVVACTGCLALSWMVGQLRLPRPGP